MPLPFLFRRINTDICIVGGGMAGVCAALAAARQGARVVLLQDRSVLGGNASSEIRMHIVGADFHGKKPGTRETGLIEELRLEDAYRNPERAYSQWDLLLYDKVVSESNITLLLDTQCTSCRTEETTSGVRIAEVLAQRVSTEEEFAIHARFFADCSGDGFLGAQAGADFRVGRERRDEYGESWAPEKADRLTLGSSILFMARRYDRPQPYRAPAWARRFSESDFVHRPIPSFEYGYWWFEWGGHLDTIRDNGAIRHELLRIALGVWNYVKNSDRYPESIPWALDWVGAVPGKRESRRFMGPHVLTQHDVLGGTIFPDTVAYGGWPVDLHPPMGIDAPEEPPCVQHHFDHLFGIPLRALHSWNVDNLFFAGRNISATHVAFASTRVMATCAVMGQAVGTAAAVFAREQTESRASISALSVPSKVAEIQRKLLRSDAFLPGIDVRDEADLVSLARIEADSSHPEHSSGNIGQREGRHLLRIWGSWSEDRRAGWFSEGLPASLFLTWQEPQTIARLHLTFDSGLERELILSGSQATNRKVIRGAQPEIARAYIVLADGRSVVAVEDNFQRLRVHTWATPFQVRRLEVRILTSNGVREARIMKIQAYGENDNRAAAKP